MALVENIPAQVSAAPAYVIPFETRGSHVLLRATVQGRAATFILDTGSSVCTLDAGWAAGMSLPAFGPPAAIAGGASSVQTRMVTIPSLRIGDLELRDQTAAMVPLTPVSEQHGTRITGTIGYPLFARFVVEIDYAARTLRLYEPAAYRYEGTGTEVPIDLAMRVPIVRAMVQATGGARTPARLVVDLGTASMGAVFTSPFGDAHAKEFDSSPRLPAQSSGVGRAGAGSVVRLDRLEIGSLVAARPVAVLMQDRTGFFGVTWADGTVGAAILGRTRLIVDYSRSRLILEAGPNFNAPFEFDASGLSLSTTGAAFDSVVVRVVGATSAAEEAGVHVGDVVLSVDDVSATGETVDRVRQMLMTPGSARTVVVSRDGTAMQFVLTLRKRI